MGSLRRKEPANDIQVQSQKDSTRQQGSHRASLTGTVESNRAFIDALKDRKDEAWAEFLPWLRRQVSRFAQSGRIPEADWEDVAMDFANWLIRTDCRALFRWRQVCRLEPYVCACAARFVQRWKCRAIQRRLPGYTALIVRAADLESEEEWNRLLSLNYVTDEVETDGEWGMIQQVRSDLTTKQFRCILLLVNGLDPGDIAHRLDMRPGTVRAIIFRARDKLRRTARTREGSS